MTDNLPAYLLGPRRQVGQDSVQGMGMPPLPSISIADNLFTLIDAAGAKLPVPTMGIIDPSAPNSPHGPYLDAILIDANKIMSKAYYPDAWRRSEDGGYKPPECWSDNGVGPSVNATKPFAKLCNTCPNAVGARQSMRKGMKSRRVTMCAKWRGSSPTCGGPARRPSSSCA